MPVLKSKHAVLTPQDLHSQTSMIIKTMLLNHSPKQVAELMRAFLEAHCKEARPDLELQEFIQKFDKQHRL